MKIRKSDKYMKTLATQIFHEEYKDYLNVDHEEHFFSNEFIHNFKSLSKKKKKRVKLNYIYRLTAACASFLLICGIIFFTRSQSNNPYNVLANEIHYNLEKLSELDINIITSSNPHAYKDSENYDNIIKLGIDAVNVLEQQYANGELEGFNAYIAATAIEDIFGISLSAITKTDWSNADEFFISWNQMISNLPLTFKTITETEDSIEHKMQKIKEYGILGRYYLSYINNCHSQSISFFGCNILTESLEPTDDDPMSEELYSDISNYLKNKYQK